MNHKWRESRGRRSKEDVKRFAEELAPPEERKREALGKTNQKREGGAIVVDEQSVNVPQGAAMERETRFVIEPVVIVILGVMLAYIAFVTWLISQMSAE